MKHQGSREWEDQGAAEYDKVKGGDGGVLCGFARGKGVKESSPFDILMCLLIEIYISLEICFL